MRKSFKYISYVTSSEDFWRQDIKMTFWMSVLLNPWYGNLIVKKHPYYGKNMSTDIPGSSYTMDFVAFSVLWKTDGETHAFPIWRDWLFFLYASLAFHKETVI